MRGRYGHGNGTADKPHGQHDPGVKIPARRVIAQQKKDILDGSQAAAAMLVEQGLGWQRGGTKLQGWNLHASLSCCGCSLVYLADYFVLVTPMNTGLGSRKGMGRKKYDVPRDRRVGLLGN